MYRIFIHNNSGINEIKKFGSVSWSDDLDTLAIQFDFTSTEIIEPGDKFLFSNDTNEIVSGIITDRDYDKNKVYHYTGFDFGFYLNKNEVVIQFNGCTISEAIRQLLNKIDIPIGNIVDIPACVKKIYKKAIVSDILKELLEMATKKTGKDYIFRCRGKKFFFEEFKKIEIFPTYELANGIKINITEAISNFSASDSIQDLKNKVVITDNKENKVYILADSSDNSSIDTYGTLQVIETPDEDDKTPKSVIAQNMLNKLNKVTKSRSVEMLGADEIEKGVILSFNYSDLGFVGQHLVTSTNHSIENGIHKLKADVEVYNG